MSELGSGGLRPLQVLSSPLRTRCFTLIAPCRSPSKGLGLLFDIPLPFPPFPPFARG